MGHEDFQRLLMKIETLSFHFLHKHSTVAGQQFLSSELVHLVVMLLFYGRSPAAIMQFHGFIKKCIFSHGECGCEELFLFVLQQEKICFHDDVYETNVNEDDLKLTLSDPQVWLEVTRQKRGGEIVAWSLWFLFWRHGIMHELGIADVINSVHDIGANRSPIPAVYVVWFSMVMADVQNKKRRRRNELSLEGEKRHSSELQRVLLSRISHIDDLCLNEILCSEAEKIASRRTYEKDVSLPGIGRRKDSEALMQALLEAFLWLQHGDAANSPVVCDMIVALTANAAQDDRSGEQLMALGKLLRGSCFVPFLIPALEYVFSEMLLKTIEVKIKSLCHVLSEVLVFKNVLPQDFNCQCIYVFVLLLPILNYVAASLSISTFQRNF